MQERYGLERVLLNSALNNLSKFSGNIITAHYLIYCEEGKLKKFCCKSDVFNPQKEHQIVIPVAGRLPYQDTLAKYIYNISIKANSVIHNGTAISEMELPVFVSNQKPLNYSTRFRIPIGKWLLSTSLEYSKPSYGSKRVR